MSNDNVLNQTDMEAARVANLMIDALPETALVRLSEDGIIQSWNKGAQQLHQYSSEEVIGEHVSMLFTDADLQSGVADRELETVRNTGLHRSEGWRKRKDGQAFWASINISEVQDEGEKRIGFVWMALDLTDRVERERLVQKQRDEILELSTPVIQVWDRVLALPIIGTLDTDRGTRLTENLLEKIAVEEAEYVILDISGVPMMDSQVVRNLLKTVQGARLMGADCVLSGVRPETAQSMVHLGIELGDVKSRATLRDALQLVLKMRGTTHQTAIGD